MKIIPKVEKALNKQINAELYSAYLYLSMSAYFEGLALKGFASWMKHQAEEEVEHAMKLFNFIYERGGNVTLTEIAKPKLKWKSPLDAFENAYEHEQLVTSLIHKLVDISRANKDHATEVMLHWFVNEQVEEEDNASDIVEKLKLVGNVKAALLVLDKRLGKRKGD